MCERVIQMANKLVIFTDATFQPPFVAETVQIAQKRLVITPIQCLLRCKVLVFVNEPIKCQR